MSKFATSCQHSCWQWMKSSGSYGWVVVLASFVAHAIADGCSYSFGVLYVELLDVFGEPRASTAWTGSLFIALPSICAPVASLLTSRFGCRVVTIIGGSIAAFGCIISSTVNSISLLCVTYGMIAGFGLALVFIPALLTVAFYFDNRRALATGIAVAGSGIGVCIFAPLTEYLIHHYSWRGTFLIIGGIMLNLVVCGALFRPSGEVESTSVTSHSESRASRCQSQYSSSETNLNYLTSNIQPTVADAMDPSNEDLMMRMTSVSLVQFPTFANGALLSQECTICQTSELVGTSVVSCILPDIITQEHSALKDQQNVIAGSSGNLKTPHPDIMDSPLAPSQNEQEQAPFMTPQSDVALPQLRSVASLISEKLHVLHLRAASGEHPTAHHHRHLMHKYRNVFYNGGLLRARVFLSPATERSASCPDVFIHASQSEDVTSNNVFERMWNFICSQIDLSIFHNGIFLIFCTHCFLLFLSYNTPYIYIPDVASSPEYGITTETASILIVVTGAASTLGEVIMGYVGDRQEVNILYLYVAMTTIAGVSTLMVSAMKSFVHLAIYCAVYGFFISANYALTTIILVSLLGLERLTNSFGIVSMIGGIAQLFGPPLAGWVADVSGSYDPVFYMAGVDLIISGLILFTVKCVGNGDSSSVGSCNMVSSSGQRDTACSSSKTAENNKLDAGNAINQV